MIPPLQIQPRENIIPIDDWQDYLHDGEKFLKTAASAFEKGKKAFSEESLYNITAMAIEKFIMAFLMRNGDLAENHTMIDLAAALKRHLKVMPAELEQKLEFLGSFQEICDMDQYQCTIPTKEEIRKIIDTGQEVQALLTPFLIDE
ncbi:HEPN domain-containing protein [Desulfopila sp. IMCC35008]|uniref:HEPN domain-containing protein n=1 Tax=Desulfopila sp. IMCC35008 TaxID=2653858 RepID=UPI0013D47291|nr:HEPN domain-containing protein [Desulfopila sp. IMCC35008]